jgi:death-on-curing protein
MLDALALHDFIMDKTGEQPAPLRDRAALESALLRPQTAAHYNDADLVEQCSVLMVGISEAQAFADGNKRTAFIAADVFLRTNGRVYTGDPLALARHLEAVAHRTDSLEEATRRLTSWLRDWVTGD